MYHGRMVLKSEVISAYMIFDDLRLMISRKPISNIPRQVQYFRGEGNIATVTKFTFGLGEKPWWWT